MPPPVKAATAAKRPRVLLFDIGGVCVVSPMQAIRDYEMAHDIPTGYVNHAISAAGESGAWAKLERGEVLMDATFFADFKRDLSDPVRWRTYFAKHQPASDSKAPPPVPDIDAEWLFYELHRMAREPDPHMFPALKKLRALADRTKDTSGELILAALSNTAIFPPGHEDSTASNGAAAVKAIFDIFVSSAHVGMRKPDPAIYRYALTRVHEYCKTRYQARQDRGVRPEDIVFLDDIGTNLRSARQLGMRTIKVPLGRADIAVRELESIMGIQLTDDGSHDNNHQKARL